jgi:type VI protein secretion system component VasK
MALVAVAVGVLAIGITFFVTSGRNGEEGVEETPPLNVEDEVSAEVEEFVVWAEEEVGRSALRAMPIFLVVGPRGVGKTAVVTYGDQGVQTWQAVEAKAHFVWHLNGAGALWIESAEPWERKPKQAGAINVLLRRLEEVRASMPIDGVVFVMDLHALHADFNGAKAKAEAASAVLRRDLQPFYNEVPVYLLMHKADEAAGFRSLMVSQLALDPEYDEPLGARLKYGPSQSAELDEQIQIVGDALVEHAWLVAINALATSPAARQGPIVDSPRQIRVAVDAARKFMVRLAPPGIDPVLVFRGLYFTSAPTEPEAGAVPLNDAWAAPGEAAPPSWEAGDRARDASAPGRVFSLRKLLMEVLPADKRIAKLRNLSMSTTHDMTWLKVYIPCALLALLWEACSLVSLVNNLEVLNAIPERGDHEQVVGNGHWVEQVWALAEPVTLLLEHDNAGPDPSWRFGLYQGDGLLDRLEPVFTRSFDVAFGDWRNRLQAMNAGCSAPTPTAAPACTEVRTAAEIVGSGRSGSIDDMRFPARGLCAAMSLDSVCVESNIDAAAAYLGLRVREKRRSPPTSQAPASEAPAPQAFYERAVDHLVDDARGDGRADISARNAFGVTEDPPFLTAPLPRSVPGAFTREGWKEFVGEALEGEVHGACEAMSVLGSPSDPRAVRAGITAAWARRYVASWQEFLRAVHYDADHLAALSADGGARMRHLVEVVDRNGSLGEAEEHPAESVIRVGFRGVAGLQLGAQYLEALGQLAQANGAAGSARAATVAVRETAPPPASSASPIGDALRGALQGPADSVVTSTVEGRVTRWQTEVQDPFATLRGQFPFDPASGRFASVESVRSLYGRGPTSGGVVWVSLLGPISPVLNATSFELLPDLPAERFNRALPAWARVARAHCDQLFGARPMQFTVLATVEGDGGVTQYFLDADATHQPLVNGQSVMWQWAPEQGVFLKADAVVIASGHPPWGLLRLLRDSRRTVRRSGPGEFMARFGRVSLLFTGDPAMVDAVFGARSNNLLDAFTRDLPPPAMVGAGST